MKLDDFVQKFLSNTILGMVSILKGIAIKGDERISAIVEVFLDMSKATWPFWGLERELLKAAERLRDQGAKEVGAAVAHVLPLIEKGEELLEALVFKSNERIVTSNTIYTKTFCEQYPHLSYNIVDTLVKIL